jgi:hypothetical protein
MLEYQKANTPFRFGLVPVVHSIGVKYPGRA